MRILSFTKVIYDGNVTFDLVCFILRYHPTKFFQLLKLIPSFLKYITLFKGETEFISEFYSVLLKNITASDLKHFQITNSHKVDLEGFDVTKQDIIVTGEPLFIVQLFIPTDEYNVIATRFDVKEMKIVGEYCYRDEKIRRLNEVGIKTIDQLFIYNFREKKLLEMSRNIFVYRGHNLIDFDTYVGRFSDKLLYSVTNEKFVAFMSFFTISAFAGFILTNLIAIFIPLLYSFIIVFIIWLITNYITTTKYILKRKYDIKSFGKFSLSLLPCFLVQVLMILIFKNFLGIFDVVTLLLCFVSGTIMSVFSVRYIESK